jgi:hypothetical protein
MAFDQRGLNDYIDVAQRLADFRIMYPSGTLQPANLAKPWELAIVTGTKKDGQETTQTFIVYTAAAYRTPDDPRPGIGVAWEVFPGRTPYTLGSELMNAETSAWGRAILAALASDSKRGVASREEVRNRQAERDDGQAAEASYRALRNAPPEVRADGSATEAELMRMQRGPEPGVTRHHAHDENDTWHVQPGQPAAPPGPPPEERPGSVTRQQHILLRNVLKAQGIATDEEARAECARRIGRPVESRGQLSYVEAKAIIEWKEPADAER